MEIKKKLGAKDWSKWGMITSVTIHALTTITYIAIKNDFPDLQKQISMSYFSFMFMLPFTPIYLSLFLDKIFGAKK